MTDPLRQLALRDGRYSPEAFRFLFESLDHAVRLAGKTEAEGTERHVTGQEVLAGMRAYASKYGEDEERWLGPHGFPSALVVETRSR